ncbi:transposase [Sphingomonas sp. Leaf33]|uniref:transposase n=1 Tax=Sphingomonas sp. Leaf33 TaxID=1736215 RepID=UPI00138F6364|nr:transposase [Sphingomonas sp. Leaf33]
MAIELSQRLDSGHRFPTPSVLAMDGIKIRGEEYMVVADGITGRPIGFIPSMRSEPIRQWVMDRLDVAAVRIFVADLHRTNTSVARLQFPNALYVADKWHVVQRFQKVLSQVINREIDRLRKAGETDRGNTIYDFKPGLMAVNKRLRRTRRTAKGGQRRLDFYDDLVSILKSHRVIRLAFWARHDLIRFYSAPTLAEALPWLDRFRRHTETFAALPDYETFEAHLTNNWTLITNYFQTTTRRSDGRWRGVTTNGLEQHNGEIRKRVRVRNGVQNLDLLRLVSVYGSRSIGEDILLCAGEGCDQAIGPVFGPPAAFEVRQAAGVFWRCPGCR